jgi:MFS superfamily sulfate permease-like transporter
VTLVRSIIYGYLGAILGGLGVAIVALPLETSLETVAGAASVTGVILGLLGLMLPWRQAAVAAGRRRP